MPAPLIHQHHDNVFLTPKAICRRRDLLAALRHNQLLTSISTDSVISILTWLLIGQPYIPWLIASASRHQALRRFSASTLECRLSDQRQNLYGTSAPGYKWLTLRHRIHNFSIPKYHTKSQQYIFVISYGFCAMTCMWALFYFKYFCAMIWNENQLPDYLNNYWPRVDISYLWQKKTAFHKMSFEGFVMVTRNGHIKASKTIPKKNSCTC